MKGAGLQSHPGDLLLCPAPLVPRKQHFGGGLLWALKLGDVASPSMGAHRGCCCWPACCAAWTTLGPVEVDSDVDLKMRLGPLLREEGWSPCGRSAVGQGRGGSPMPALLKGTAASPRWDSREDLYLGASCSK